MRSFFSCPPVSRYAPAEDEDEVVGERATVRTMWLCANVWRASPEKVSHTLLYAEGGEGGGRHQLSLLWLRDADAVAFSLSSDVIKIRHSRGKVCASCRGS